MDNNLLISNEEWEKVKYLFNNSRCNEDLLNKYYLMVNIYLHKCINGYRWIDIEVHFPDFKFQAIHRLSRRWRAKKILEKAFELLGKGKVPDEFRKKSLKVYEYESDISDKEWEAIKIILKGNFSERYLLSKRDTINALLYSFRTPCPISKLPSHFPSYQLISRFYRELIEQDKWPIIWDLLRGKDV